MAATRQGRGKRRKRRLLDSAGAVKLFARQTKLMSATLERAVAIFLLAQNKRKKSLEEAKLAKR